MKKMVVNDQSLVWGGLFDISSDWSWSHQLHRKGDCVDIPFGYYVGTAATGADFTQWTAVPPVEPATDLTPGVSDNDYIIYLETELKKDFKVYPEKYKKKHFHCMPKDSQS